MLKIPSLDIYRTHLSRDVFFKSLSGDSVLDQLSLLFLYAIQDSPRIRKSGRDKSFLRGSTSLLFLGVVDESCG